MKVKVSDIKESGIELSQEIDAADLGLDAPEGRAQGFVRINARFAKQGNDIMVDGNFSAEVNLLCDRCLANFQKRLQQDFHFDYNLGNAETLDITDDLRQEILLDFPVKALCRQDCKGLCPNCGMNLNEGDCQCNK